MIQIQRTNSENVSFIGLVRALDADLRIRDGDDHAFYNQFNQIDSIRHAVVVFEGQEAVACGAIKPFGTDAMEVKRMYVLPEKRGQGLARLILKELERWAAELGYKR